MLLFSKKDNKPLGKKSVIFLSLSHKKIGRQSTVYTLNSYVKYHPAPRFRRLRYLDKLLQIWVVANHTHNKLWGNGEELFVLLC